MAAAAHHEPRPDLRHIGVWLFDLDNTLYPPETELMTLVEGRMTDFMQARTGLPRDEARAIQKSFYHEHGTTLAGLMANYDIDPEDFLTQVHDVSLDRLPADPALRSAIASLPGRRLVFTNGSADHAQRVLEKLALADLFEDVFHIASADYIPKPAPQTFDKMARTFSLSPEATCFFEDSEKNLKPAAAIGMTTVLVGPHAAASSAPFVHHRTNDLAGFLTAARTTET
jgi:putative hydrolase of the HAD superfamily